MTNRRISLALAMIIGLAAASCGSNADEDGRPFVDDGFFDASPDRTSEAVSAGTDFETLSQVAIRSDLVIEGVVTGFEKGWQLPDSTLRFIVVDVTRTYLGVATDSLVFADGSAVLSDGDTIGYADEPWLQEGDQIVAFLRTLSVAGFEPSTYEPVVGISVIEPNGELLSPPRLSASAPLANSVDLAAAMENALAEIESDNVPEFLTAEEAAVLAETRTGDSRPLSTVADANGAEWTLHAAPTAVGLCYSVDEDSASPSDWRCLEWESIVALAEQGPIIYPARGMDFSLVVGLGKDGDTREPVSARGVEDVSLDSIEVNLEEAEVSAADFESSDWSYDELQKILSEISFYFGPSSK